MVIDEFKAETEHADNTQTPVRGQVQDKLHLTFSIILPILLEKVKKSQPHFSVSTTEQAEAQLHVNPSSTIAVI